LEKTIAGVLKYRKTDKLIMHLLYYKVSGGFENHIQVPGTSSIHWSNKIGENKDM